MTETGKYFVLDINPFRCDLLISFHKDFQELSRVLKRKLPEEQHSEIEKLNRPHADANTIIFSNGATCIHFKTFDTGILVHEVFHVIFFITARLGIKLKAGSDEVYAYLLQHIVNRILDHPITKEFVNNQKINSDADNH
jgi:hypothetical protein